VTSAAPTPGQDEAVDVLGLLRGGDQACLETQMVQREEDALRVARPVVENADHSAI
jgi:hypothetical protein